MDALPRFVLILALVARLATAEKKCENSGGDSECGLQVVKAMVDGFAKHPEKFIGLTVHSSYSDFQAYFHNTGMHGCPRPCLPQEEKCVKFGPVYPGMKAVLWVRNDGMRNHPQWFPELSSGSSDLEIAKVLYQHGNKETPRVCQDDEEEGHFVPAEQWDAFKRKSANPQPKQAAHLEKPFLNCGSHGIGFSVLDFEGHFPVTKPSSYACRTHCADEKATYFNYYAPTQTCHCPPPTAKMVKEIVEENIGGKVRCASTEYIKKLETSEHAEPAVYEAVAFAVPLLLMMVFMVAAVAAISLSRKRCRQLQTLSESGLVAAETGKAVGEEGHERILMMGTLLQETTGEIGRAHV